MNKVPDISGLDILNRSVSIDLEVDPEKAQIFALAAVLRAAEAEIFNFMLSRFETEEPAARFACSFFLLLGFALFAIVFIQILLFVASSSEAWSILVN